MSDNCIFCDIVSQKIPVPFIQETDDLIVIKDKAPKAPVHYLIIPKKHVADIQSLDNNDHALAGNIVMMARKLSEDLSESKDFKFVINSGKEAGQCVFHLHAHFLSGKKLGEI